MNTSDSRDIVCRPLDDTTKRFLLGKKGNTEMLAIGLNPSIANENKLDPTSRNIQTIADNNGCDGWWLINLYPMRTPNPKELPDKINEALAEENFNFINEILNNDSFNISKVVCCWGNHVDDHLYLGDQASKITNLMKESGFKCHCIGTTNSGNPYHPAPMPVNRFLGGIQNIKLEEYE